MAKLNYNESNTIWGDLFDFVVASTSTLYINCKGGVELTMEDYIKIPEGGPYNLTIVLDSFTYVENKASRGVFTYIVTGQKGMSVNTKLADSHSRKHKFVISNQNFSNLNSIERKNWDTNKNHYDLVLTFTDQSTVQFKLNMKNVFLIFNDKPSVSVQESSFFADVITKKSIEIDNEWLPKVNHLNMTIRIRNKETKQSVMIGNEVQNIFQNDPELLTKIFVNGGDKSNLFVLNSNEECFTEEEFPMKGEVYVFINYTHSPMSDNAIDLRQIVKNVHNCYGKEVMLSHIIHENSISIELYDSIHNTYRFIMRIQLLNIDSPCNYLEKFSITLHSDAAMQLKCDDKHKFENIKITAMMDSYQQADHMIPRPLTFDATINLIFISHKDIDINSKLNVRKAIGNPVWIKYQSNLILTNIDPNEKSAQSNEKVIMIWFSKFNEMSEVFYTVELNTVDNGVIALNNERNKIAVAPHYDDFDSFCSYFDNVDFQKYELN